MGLAFHDSKLSGFGAETGGSYRVAVGGTSGCYLLISEGRFDNFSFTVCECYAGSGGQIAHIKVVCVGACTLPFSTAGLATRSFSVMRFSDQFLWECICEIEELVFSCSHQGCLCWRLH